MVRSRSRGDVWNSTAVASTARLLYVQVASLSQQGGGGVIVSPR